VPDRAVPGRIVLASANPKKAAELRAILDGAGLGAELLARPDGVPEVVEDAPDFLGNARLKAAALAAATGEWALADDSGLEVDALGGAPGVHSARFAGPDADDAGNVARLLDDLDAVGAVGAEQRVARFRCVIVLRAPDGAETVAEGSVDGRIAPAARGRSGFGYDPVFVPDAGDGRTFAEMDAAEKHAMSHRGRALASLAQQLTSGR
jgi:XTP/dITP diphosphohydrolase